MRNRFFIFLVVIAGNAPGVLKASTEGSGKDPVPFLSLPVSARSLAMGQSAIGVKPVDGAGAEKNPALLGLLESQSIVASQGNFGLDRKLNYLSYNLPIFWIHHAGFHLSPSSSLNPEKDDLSIRSDALDESQRNSTNRWLQHSKATLIALALGYETFGVGDIPGRTEFGAPSGSYEDKENILSASVALRTHENMSFGLTTKMIKQKLEDSSAKGTVFDAGIAYRCPIGYWDRFLFGLSMQNFGSKYKWEVNDPILNYKFKFQDAFKKKCGMGVSYVPENEKITMAVDLVKVDEESLQLHTGLEWEVARGIFFRAGSNSYNPTAGIGISKSLKYIDLALHYAFQYDLDSLSNLNLFTLTCKWTVHGPTEEEFYTPPTNAGLENAPAREKTHTSNDTSTKNSSRPSSHRRLNALPVKTNSDGFSK